MSCNIKENLFILILIHGFIPKNKLLFSSQCRSVTSVSHQLSLHIFVSRRTDEDCVLHETHEAPERVALVLDLRQQRGHQIWHALTVAHVWIQHGVV